MEKGIEPQYLLQSGSPKVINRKTRIHCDLPVIKELLESQRGKSEEATDYYKEIYFHREVPQDIAEKVMTQFQLPYPDNPEGHIIKSNQDEIHIYGLTDRALFYGCIALQQLMANGSLKETLAYDFPVCPERGLKVFLPSTKSMPYFKKFIDMICYFKFNSIMIEVGGAMEYKRHPEINEGWVAYCQEMGEYSGKTTKIQDYTYPWYKNAIHMENGDGTFLKQEEVRELVQYCKDRKMEVIPEVPSLGHCDYLMLGHPEIAERPEDPYADTYCPSNPASYELLFDVLDEVMEVFQPKVINVGHDEYYTIGVCDKCKDKTGAELFAGDLIKINDYLKAKGVKTMIWGDKLLKNAWVPGAGPFGGAEIQMYMPQFHREDGKPIGIMPATYPAIDMLPKDILILHWNWNLGEELEDEFLDKGWDIRYGNFEGYYFNHWQEHIAKSKNGAFISNWSSLNEVILQRNSIFFGLSYAYEMFWNHNYKEADYETIRDKSFANLYRYKYAEALERKEEKRHNGHPQYIKMQYHTDYFVKFKYFVDGVFPEKEVYEIGQMVLEYEDGTVFQAALTYGENIGHYKVGWKRREDGDKGYNHGYKLDDHLLEMAMNTLPIPMGEETYYEHLLKNPYPDKVLKSFSIVVNSEKECKVTTKEITYLS